MTERRYSEEEVAEIFDKATTTQLGGRRQLSAGDGMTLAGLQDIGREVGIPPELVAQAAHALDRRGSERTRRFLGLPIGVGKTVDLGRKLSDAEWERLVVDLRETFDASGRVKQEGGFRQWRNGNLQVLLEPTATGHQVRMQTIKSQSVGLIAGGLGLFGVAVAFAVSLAFAGKLGAEKPMASLFFMLAMGATALAWGALILPSWARLRRRQMEELTDRLTLPPG